MAFPSTISRAINKVEAIIADVLAEFVSHPDDVPDGIVVLVDGTHMSHTLS